MAKLSPKISPESNLRSKSNRFHFRAKHLIPVLPVLGLSAVFASDVADRAEKAINELGALEIESFDKNTSAAFANDLEAILKMQHMEESPQIKISNLRLKIRTLEAEIDQQRSGGPTTSTDTIKSFMEKNDELRRLKSELRKLEAENGIEASFDELPAPNVNKLQNNYDQLVEERNQMQKEKYEMEKKMKQMEFQIRNDQEREYLESLNQGTGSISSMPTQPATPPSSNIAKISEPNPYISDDTFSGLESFLQSENVLAGAPKPEVKQPSASKFSGLLEDDPTDSSSAPTPEPYQPVVPRNPAIARIASPPPSPSPSPALPSPDRFPSAPTSPRPEPTPTPVVSSFQFVPPVESKPVTTTSTDPLYFAPPVTTELPAPKPLPISKRRIRPEVVAPQDVYEPEVPDSLLRALAPPAPPAPPAAPADPVPSVSSPAITPVLPRAELPILSTPANSSLEDMLGVEPSAPVSDPDALSSRTFGVSEPVAPPAPAVEAISNTPSDDESLFAILGNDSEVVDPISDPTMAAEPPTLLNTTPRPEPTIPEISDPEPDFSIFDDPGFSDIPEVTSPPTTLENELATAPISLPPANNPVVEEYRPSPDIPVPPIITPVPSPEETIPDTLEFYDLPSFDAPVRSVESEANTAAVNPEVVSTPSTSKPESSSVAESTPPALKPVQRPKIVRTRAPSSTTSLQIETGVEKLSGGKPMPADYTEFYITTADFTEIVLNSPELKEAMDKAITGKSISSYAELWARSQKYGYNYPGLSSMIRKTLRKNGIHRIRTNAKGTAKVRVSSKLLEPGQPEVYYITGVAMLGKVGVVWSKPFYIEDHAGQDNPVLLENADALWLE